MNQALQCLFGLSEKEFFDLKKEMDNDGAYFDGDFPQLWGQWHRDTKQEIYCLIWVTQQLGLDLPRLVFESIGFWLQLGTGQIILEIVHNPSSALLPKLLALTKGWSYDYLTDTYENGSIAVCYTTYWSDSKLYNQYCCKMRSPQVDRSELNRYEAACFQKVLERKDRLRIVLPNRSELDNYLRQLK